MNYTLTFRSAKDPALMAQTGNADSKSGTFSQMPVHGIAIGAKDRFTRELQTFLGIHYPDMILGDELTVFHPELTRMDMSSRLRRISLWTTEFAGYNDTSEVKNDEQQSS